MIKNGPALFLTFSLSLSLLPGARASEAVNYFNGVSRPDLSELVRDLRSGGKELPEAPAPEPAKGVVAPAAELTPINGFLSRVEGKFYVASNLYFTHKGESYLLEDFTGLHKFSLQSQDLYAAVKGAGDFRLGRINIDPAALKEGERAPFELVSKFEASMVHYNWKLPKVKYELAAGITGIGWVKRVIERTEKIISLKTPEGLEFCYYENIPGKVKGALYSAPAGCR